MRIAIVTPYPLLSIGLKHLFQSYFDIVPELYNQADALLASHPESFDAYLITAETLVENSDFFLPRKNRILLLSTEPKGRSKTTLPTLFAAESKESLLEKIDQFIELLDKQSETLSPELSPREAEVLQLVARGLINKEIAEQLNISVNTVLSHRKNLTAKLGIKTVSGLSFYAMMNGYLSDIDQK